MRGVSVYSLESIDKVAENYCKQGYININVECNEKAIKCLNNITEKEILFSINGIGPKKQIIFMII